MNAGNRYRLIKAKREQLEAQERLKLEKETKKETEPDTISSGLVM
jgi:hypothetical protein